MSDPRSWSDVERKAWWRLRYELEAIDRIGEYDPEEAMKLIGTLTEEVEMVAGSYGDDPFRKR